MSFIGYVKYAKLILYTYICCRELFVVEVKNWSGAIELQPDGSWLQIRRNGTVQKHSNVVSSLN